MKEAKDNSGLLSYSDSIISSRMFVQTGNEKEINNSNSSDSCKQFCQSTTTNLSILLLCNA